MYPSSLTLSLCIYICKMQLEVWMVLNIDLFAFSIKLYFSIYYAAFIDKRKATELEWIMLFQQFDEVRN